MALKGKVDYFGISTTGLEVASTSENRSQDSAEATGADGFVVANTTVGDEAIAPQCDYVVTGDVTLSGVKLGSVKTVDGKTIALASITIATRAGEAPTVQAKGQQIEAGGTARCTVTLSDISISALFHAQDFGLFTISGGQLQDSTLTIEGTIATAKVDGVIKASDLTGGKMSISGTVVGVSDAGAISTPTLAITPGKNGIVTQPLTETNPNGDYPSYTFTAEFPLAADKNG